MVTAMNVSDQDGVVSTHREYSSIIGKVFPVRSLQWFAWSYAGAVAHSGFENISSLFAIMNKHFFQSVCFDAQKRRSFPALSMKISWIGAGTLPLELSVTVSISRHLHESVL